MCQHLAAIEVPSSIDSNETTNFRKLFLKKCQREFTNIVAELVDIEKKKKKKKKKKEIEYINDVEFYFFISFNQIYLKLFILKCRNRRTNYWEMSLVR